MVTAIEPLLREQLIERRQKLESAASAFHRPTELTRLLHEVDAALHRMDTGVFGLCEVCQGRGEICNAGHLPPLLVQKGAVTRINATGLPIGVFCSESFSCTSFQMQQGDSLFLYTDGFSEGADASGQEFGIDRLSMLLQEKADTPPRTPLDLSLGELKTFAHGRAPFDDLTLMAIQRAA